MTAAYWLIGQRIVEFEQKGQIRAEYGVKLLERLAKDLNARFGRGFSYSNLNRFRQFYLTFPLRNNLSTLSIESGQPILSTLSMESNQHVKSFLDTASKRFSLPWSAYVRLLSVKNENARRFYETEALRGGWSVRQLNRQISSQFYELITIGLSFRMLPLPAGEGWGRGVQKLRLCPFAVCMQKK
jgi:hypothetical protein